jgi:hypothetical protein
LENISETHSATGTIKPLKMFYFLEEAPLEEKVVDEIKDTYQASLS